MNSMAIDRRTLLLGTFAAFGAQRSLSARAQAGDVAGRPTQADIAFVSAAKRADGRYAVLLLAADGGIVRGIPLSGRGHDIAFDVRSGRAVAFARRPGTFAVAFDVSNSAPPQIFTAADGRHFYGHGAFSRDGRLLYVSENDIAGARGVIGIYDVAAGYKKIGEHPSHGVGPHEIILLEDGRTLAVANGGLDTVPELDRVDLNRDAMQPSLTFVDAESGELRAKHMLPPALNQLSIRHIVADRSGAVWFGAQWEGGQTETPQLIGSAGIDRTVRLIDPPAGGDVDLRGYVGSVAASRDGTIIAASAPKAGRILYIDASNGAIAGVSELKDACGIAGDHDALFASTSGFGVIRHEQPGALPVSQTQLQDISFDNHLRRWG